MSLFLNSLAAVLGGFLTIVVVLGVYVVGKVAAHLASEEAEGRINQLGYALLHLVCKRLPEDLREVYYDFWAADLDAYYQNAEHRPLTRLFWSLWFPLPLLFNGRKVARIMDPKSFVDKESIFKRFFTGPVQRALQAALSAAGMATAIINSGAQIPPWLQYILIVTFGSMIVTEMTRQFGWKAYLWLKSKFAS